jgi:hypothetical protein
LVDSDEVALYDEERFRFIFERFNFLVEPQLVIVELDPAGEYLLIASHPVDPGLPRISCDQDESTSIA